MIGHYLLHLTMAQEDRVLTTGMRPGRYTAPCLVGVVVFKHIQTRHPVHEAAPLRFWPRDADDIVRSITSQFDELCSRFGVERIGEAIRNRILSNRARRVLQNVSELVGVRTPADTPDHTETT